MAGWNFEGLGAKSVIQFSRRDEAPQGEEGRKVTENTTLPWWLCGKMILLREICFV